MRMHRTRALSAAVTAVLLFGMATAALATEWQVQPLISTPANEYFPVWSPDGQQVAYISDAAGVRQVFIANADGTGAWQVTSDPNGAFEVVWAPDSQWLVYSQSESSPKDLIKVVLNETRDAVASTLNLTNEGAPAYYTEWREQQVSPDGLMIVAVRVYNSRYYLHVVNADGTNLHAVGNPLYARHPSWKPDGSVIAYGYSTTSTGLSSIYTVEPDGASNGVLVDSSQTGQHIVALGWSPDGTAIAFSRGQTTTSFVGVVIFLEGGFTVSTLEAAPAGFVQPTITGPADIWSPDGSRLLYNTWENYTWPYLYVINKDGTGKELITSEGNNTRARFGPTGSVIFQTDRAGNWDIYVSTSNRPPVADAGGPYIAPATSWDGAAVELDGTASSDPDGDLLAYSWKIGEEEIGTDAVVTCQFPIGLTDVTLTVTDPSGLSGTAQTTVTVTVIDVQIDIRPGTDVNRINLNSNGILPVVFLTDEVIDAATIDPMTVTMAGLDFGGMIRVRGNRNPQPAAWLLDVDEDGDDDLLVHVEIENLNLDPTDTVCVFGALTYEGLVVQGQDDIVIWPTW
ncbi:MAG: PD40 domain-containing protein [Verrucomicrobia bacterium]|nr:PD40 domain-containing protein [Verrucomicrobiota bacterium]